MALRRIGGLRRLLVAVTFIALGVATIGCSSDPSAEPADADSTGADSAADGDSDDPADSVDSSGDSAGDPDSSNGDPTDGVPTAQPVLADEVLAAVTDLRAGDEVLDAQGNLVTVYGVAEWPSSFDALTDAAQETFPFFGDILETRNPEARLVAFDIGMCAAGIGATGRGTAEFFAHSAATDPLSTDPVLDRGVPARHPVVQPSFESPSAAECDRGWLPVLWGGGRTPSVARYVVSTRPNGQGDIERHVYQWELTAGPQLPGQAADADDDDAGSGTEDPARIGQTVTFAAGPLADTTVVLNGWAELVGLPSEIDGTRVVSVYLDVCPVESQRPDFGLGVEGWNLIAPLDPGALYETVDGAPAEDCVEGWLDFAAPFGAIPTSFFASDGQGAVTGYAQWTLADAAIAPPE